MPRVLELDPYLAHSDSHAHSHSDADAFHPFAHSAGTVPTVVLGGEIDGDRVIEAERIIRVAEREHADLVLDLRTATLLDSTALNLIADTALRARTRGGTVKVVVTHPRVRRLLRMMFFDELVEVQPPLTAKDGRDGPSVLPL